jgi:phage terminase large subunit
MASSARDLLARYRREPNAFHREVLRFEPWSAQRAISEAVRDHPRVAVRSAHGIGKTAIAARVALWYLAVHPSSRVIVTAPTSQQLRNVFWREVALAYRASDGFIGGELLGDRLELADDWFMAALSTDRPERFQGHHAERLLLVVDEASGVSEEIFEAASGFLTSPEARLLLIGNPTQTSGEFFSAFHENRGLYRTIHVPASSTPAFTGETVPTAVLRKLVSRKWVEDHTRKWGAGSPLSQVRIEAEFPSESDDVVVSLGDLEQARRQALEPGTPLVLSVDVARFGSDQTVMAVRRGPVVRLARSYGGRDTMRTVGEITALARRLRAEHGRRPLVVVDDAGVGGGVTDRLRELGEFPVLAFTGAGRARQPDDYPNRRSESWFELAERLPELDLDDDEELAADLLAPRYSLDSQARRVVERKEETKKRLRRSPDRGDAVVMAFAHDGVRPLRAFAPRGRIGDPPRRVASVEPVRAEREPEERARRSRLAVFDPLRKLRRPVEPEVAPSGAVAHDAAWVRGERERRARNGARGSIRGDRQT